MKWQHGMLLVSGLVLAGGMAWSGEGEGQGQEGGGRERGPRKGQGEGMARPLHPVPPLIAALDLDKDGVISADEIADAADSLLKLDKNGDGKLNPEELFPRLGEGEGPGQGPGRGRMKPGEGAGQGGHQGGHRGGEQGGAQGGAQGGQQGGPQGQGPHGPPPGGLDGKPPRFGPPPVIAALDADRDHELSADEIENALAALKKLDKNGDGKLDREELRPKPPEGEEGNGPRPQRGPRGKRGGAEGQQGPAQEQGNF